MRYILLFFLVNYISPVIAMFIPSQKNYLSPVNLVSVDMAKKVITITIPALKTDIEEGANKLARIDSLNAEYNESFDEKLTNEIQKLKGEIQFSISENQLTDFQKKLILLAYQSDYIRGMIFNTHSYQISIPKDLLIFPSRLTREQINRYITQILQELSDLYMLKPRKLEFVDRPLWYHISRINVEEYLALRREKQDVLNPHELLMAALINKIKESSFFDKERFIPSLNSVIQKTITQSLINSNNLTLKLRELYQKNLSAESITKDKDIENALLYLNLNDDTYFDYNRLLGVLCLLDVLTKEDPSLDEDTLKKYLPQSILTILAVEKNKLVEKEKEQPSSIAQLKQAENVVEPTPEAASHHQLLTMIPTSPSLRESFFKKIFEYSTRTRDSIAAVIRSITGYFSKDN
jgi:hypothetical protein